MTRVSATVRNPLRASGAALLLAGVALLGPGRAFGTIVSGTVTDPLGVPVVDVDLDFIDVATGIVVPMTGDNTDVLGIFAVDVPAGTYDIQFEPLPGDRFIAVELPAVVIAGTSQTIDRVLERGFEIRARILDPALAPLPGAALRVRDPVTGTRPFSPYDKADAAGLVFPVVPGGTWTLRILPPAAGELIPALFGDVAVTADLDLGDVILVRGHHLTGRVVGSDGPPLPDARVTAVDVATGLAPDFGDAVTDPAGLFDFFVPAGDYRLDVVPGAGQPYVGRSFHGVGIAADRPLPDLPLDRAAVVRGSVTDDRAGGVEAVDLDFDSVFSGRRVLTLRDDTEPAGDFEVIVPLGTYDIGFDPPAGSGLVAEERLDVAVGGDLRLPTVVLRSGFVVDGRVLDAGGGNAADVRTEAFDAATGAEVALTPSRTDAGGRFEVVLPPGTWRVAFTPGEGFGSGAAETTATVVDRDVTLPDVTLPAASGASVASIAPGSGPDVGGTLVTVTGTGFQPGARARAGGLRLLDVTVLDATTLRGTTAAHPWDLVDVEVINPGATAATLPGAFAYVATEPATPVLTVRRGGPLRNDVELTWTDAGRPSWSIFRGADPTSVGGGDLVDVVPGTRYRDDGALVLHRGLVVYLVD